MLCHRIASPRPQKDGQTALHIAADEGDDIMVKFFYSIHANPNIADHLGNGAQVWFRTG